MNRTRTKRLPFLLALALLPLPGPLIAQQYPSRPIRMIVPFEPGGSIDVVARQIAEPWGSHLKQQIVVDNRGGAGGTLGTALVANAKARPGQLNYASSGIGSGIHLTAELFKTVSGVDIVHVPYKGIGQAGPDIASGRIQVLVNTYSSNRLAAGDVEVIASSPEELGRFLRAESTKWAKVINTVGVKAE